MRGSSQSKASGSDLLFGTRKSSKIEIISNAERTQEMVLELLPWIGGKLHEIELPNQEKMLFGMNQGVPVVVVEAKQEKDDQTFSDKSFYQKPAKPLKQLFQDQQRNHLMIQGIAKALHQHLCEQAIRGNVRLNAYDSEKFQTYGELLKEELSESKALVVFEFMKKHAIPTL